MKTRAMLGGTLAAALVLTLAACSTGAEGTPPPSATPSPAVTPSPSPSPTPVDAAAAFLAALSDPGFTARAEIGGEMTIGALELPIEGSSVMAGGDSQSTMTITMGATVQTTETISIGNREYKKEFGLWFEQEPDGGSDSMASALLGLRGFVDRGVETRGGTQVHRLELEDGESVPLSAFGIDDPSIRDGQADVTAFARADGTPDAMTFDFTWTQTVGETTVDAAMTFEMTFEDVGKPMRIEAPRDAWAWFESDFGYRIGHPATWDVEPGSENESDFISGFDLNYLAVSSGPSEGDPLSVYVAYITKNVDEWYEGTKGEIDASAATTLGGAKARQLDLHITWEDGPYWLIDVLAVHEDVFYSVTYVVERAPTAEDRALFEQMLATLSFT